MHLPALVILGHNMGAHHDKYARFGDRDVATSDYNHGTFGHTVEAILCEAGSPSELYMPSYLCGVSIKFSRSIMSYADYCQDVESLSCPRIPFYSSDASSGMIFPFGRPDEDNLRVHDENAQTVASYR